MFLIEGTLKKKVSHPINFVYLNFMCFANHLILLIGKFIINKIYKFSK